MVQTVTGQQVFSSSSDEANVGLVISTTRTLDTAPCEHRPAYWSHAMLDRINSQAELLSQYLASIHRKITHGQSLEAMARIFGSKTWNHFQREYPARLTAFARSLTWEPAGQASKTPVISSAEPVGLSDRHGLLDVSVRSLMTEEDEKQYPDSRQHPAWVWIEQHAAFYHKENGHSFTLEFMVNAEEEDREILLRDMPEVLRGVFYQAWELDCKWLLFYHD
jgi:hypothetical protein